MKAREAVLRLFFPPRCLGCEAIIHIDSSVPYCNKCYVSLNSAKISANISVPPEFCDKAFVLFHYSEDTVKRTVFHIKNYFSPPFEEFFVSLCKCLFENTDILQNVDLITYVTRKRSERLKTGIDQSKMMARAISKTTKVPYKKTLRRVRDAKVQHTLTREERFENVKGLFVCDKNLKGKNVMIVDDVFTTGATVSECARILKKSGAKSVTLLTFSC